MNRIKRDYCSKHLHPRWRAWKAKYDMTDIAWPWLGEFCTYCGSRVDGVGEGSPDSRLTGRLRILRDLEAVDYEYVEQFRSRLKKYDEKIRNLRNVAKKQQIRTEKTTTT